MDRSTPRYERTAKAHEESAEQSRNDALAALRAGVKPTVVGTYQIVCAELCGLGHSTMRGTAHVLPRGQYNAWLAKLKAAAKPSARIANPAARPLLI